MAMRNPIRNNVKRTITLLQRYRSKVYVFFSLHYSTDAILFHHRQLRTFILTTLSNCYQFRETIFFKNYKNNNHNLIKKYKPSHFCNVKFYNTFRMQLTKYRYWNKSFKVQKLVRNICMKTAHMHSGGRARAFCAIPTIRTFHRYYRMFSKSRSSRRLWVFSLMHFNKLRSDDDVISIFQNYSLMRSLIPVGRLYPASLEVVQ